MKTSALSNANISGMTQLPSRSPWKLKFNSLQEVQKIIDFENCDNGQIGESWIPGWCTFWPGGKITLDLQTETLITKISFFQANCLARASRIIVSCSKYPTGPFTPIYNLLPKQPNRRQLAIPPSENFDACSSFYMFGHVFNSAYPEPWARVELGNDSFDIDDLHSWTLCNSGGIERLPLEGSGTSMAARYWQFYFPESNGSHYIGINQLVMFGNPNPLPAPENVTVSVVSVDGRDCFQLSWRFAAAVSAGAACGFKVVIFSNSAAMGAGGFEHICGPDTLSLNIDGLSKTVFYSFVVFAIDGSGNEGVPSAVTSPMCLAIDHEWELVSLHIDLQETSADLCSQHAQEDDAFLEKASVIEAQETAAAFSLSEIPEADLHGVPEVPKHKLVEHAALKELLQRAHRKVLNAEDYAEEFNQHLSKLISGHFIFASDVKVAENVTVFISSTFDDTSVERNYMMEHAFPILTDYCRARGLTFSVVDLRW